jgi:hypothetical protein
MVEIGSHYFKQRPRVDALDSGFRDGDRQSGVSHSPDE